MFVLVTDGYSSICCSFYNLTIDGCTPCGCNLDGTVDGTCDKQTGVCTCKSNTQGEKCDQCRDGNIFISYFYDAQSVQMLV